MKDRGCLLCRHFKPIPPRDWKPSRDGETYDIYDVRKRMRETNGVHQDGWCTLNPTYVEVSTGHFCGHFLFAEYAVKSLTEYLWGTWREREADENLAKVKKLSRELKVAREVSRGRLEKLKNVERGKSKKPDLKIVG